MRQPELLFRNMLDNTTSQINEGVCVQIKRAQKFNFTNTSIILRQFHRDNNQIVYQISLT
jgi:hypothetical protein